MTERTDHHDSGERPGEQIDEGTTAELLQDKQAAESILRGEAEADQRSVNDAPGFNDGVLGGSDFEDRRGEPNNNALGSDVHGDAEGGVGQSRSGGVDGGPKRTHPLPGKEG